jgi:pSer/pThr/pTyr-binding forkhead associated (FHA) protein
MMKCPVCQYNNEDGALFCDQCKSDLSPTQPIPEEQGPTPAWIAAPTEPESHTPTAVLETSPPLAALVEPGAPIEAAIPMVDSAAIAVAEAVPVSEEIPTAVPIDVVPPAAIVEAQVLDSPTAAPAPPAAIPLEGPAPARLTKPKLVVLRGQRLNVEYPLYEGENYIGRADDKAVDVDLEDQEPPERIWSSRQHALIVFKDGELTLEDLNSTNGTFVNRLRVHPGQKRPLQINDVIQIGTVHLKVTE